VCSLGLISQQSLLNISGKNTIIFAKKLVLLSGEIVKVQY
jgi:hypothetical protein